MPENMSWLEAREAARSGLHVRREAWAASCWLIYQRGVAWFWNGAAWRVVDAPDFGRAEFEAKDWTTIPRALKDCCREIAFSACDGAWNHYTGFSNPYAGQTNARLIHREGAAIIDLRRNDSSVQGLGDGTWVALNPTMAAFDYSFPLGIGESFSIRTMAGKHVVNVPIRVTVCFGEQMLPDDGAPTLQGGDEGDDTPPKPPPLPPPIPPRPKPKPICTDYEYPARGASSGEIFGEITISNPYHARARVTITGGVDDELVVNGSRAEGGSRSAHGDVNYSLELGAGESCTIGGADNYGGNVWYNYRVCVERL